MTSLAMMATGGGIPIRQTKFAPDGVKFCEDVSEGRWVEKHLSDSGMSTVSSLLPNGFPAYARVFHPAYLNDEERRWCGCLLGLHQRNQDPGSQWRRSLAGQRALRCVQRCSGPHPFLLNPSSHSAPLINYTYYVCCSAWYSLRQLTIISFIAGKSSAAKCATHASILARVVPSSHPTP